MAENIKFLTIFFYGLSSPKVCHAAYAYAGKLNAAGRNLSITVGQPKATSSNHLTLFNKEVVTLFFRNLEDIIEKHKFPASKMTNNHC